MIKQTIPGRVTMALGGSSVFGLRGLLRVSAGRDIPVLSGGVRILPFLVFISMVRCPPRPPDPFGSGGRPCSGTGYHTHLR